MNFISQVRHGSHLYGLDTIDSDVDYKGIFLPTFEEMVTGTAKHEFRSSTGPEHSKNSPGDVDTVYFSLQKFISMACNGDLVTLDYLHVNDENLISSSLAWRYIVANRSKFYTKNMKSSLGFMRKMIAKYSADDIRAAAIQQVLVALKEVIVHSPGSRMDHAMSTYETLQDIAEKYPKYVRVFDGVCSGVQAVETKILEVCGAKYHFTATVEYVADAVQKKYDWVKQQQLNPQDNNKINWSTVSHMLRAGYQLSEIYETGDLKYPLKNKEFLLAVKQGNLDFFTQVAPELERLYDKVETLAKNSNLPETVDHEFWNNFIVDVYSNPTAKGGWGTALC